MSEKLLQMLLDVEQMDTEELKGLYVWVEFVLWKNEALSAEPPLSIGLKD